MKKNIVYTGICLLLMITSCKKDEKSLVVAKIKGAAKLATTETTLSKIVFATQEKRFIRIIRMQPARFAAHTKAYVKAGVDLDELKPEDVKIDKESIQLYLPPVKVLDFSYPFGDYVIDYAITENSFANKITIFDHERLYREAELEIRKTLEYTGIKKATERHTRQLFENLLKNLGYKDVYIFFKEGEFIVIPPDIETGEEEK